MTDSTPFAGKERVPVTTKSPASIAKGRTEKANYISRNKTFKQSFNYLKFS